MCGGGIVAFADPVTRSIVDSGRGTQPAKVTVAEAVTRGDVLGYSAGWKRALATAGSVIQGRLVALESAASGAECPVSANPVVGGYTGATAGNPVYVAEGTDNGKITETIPTTQNDATTVVGIALSATTVLFCLNSRADSVVP
jgi:hypothetical protein